MAASPSTDQRTSPVSPWATPNTKAAEPCSLAAVMDEEYAEQLMRQDFGEDFSTAVIQERNANQSLEQKNEDAAIKSDDTDSATSNDLLLAQMLQMEFNKEHDEYIRVQERNMNQNNKVTMSYKNYLSTHPYDEEEVAPSEESTSLDSDEDDFFWATQLDTTCQERRPKGSNLKQDGEMITKHNPTINKKKNAKNLDKFPPAFQSGDVQGLSGFSNKILNQLKQHSSKEMKTSIREHEKKEHSTHEKALDENTRLQLYKMVNNGMLDTIDGKNSH